MIGRKCQSKHIDLYYQKYPDQYSEIKSYLVFKFYYFFALVLQLQYYQILLKSVNIWPSNHKNKKGELFLRHSVYIICISVDNDLNQLKIVWIQFQWLSYERYLNI